MYGKYVWKICMENMYGKYKKTHIKRDSLYIFFGVKYNKNPTTIEMMNVIYY